MVCKISKKLLFLTLIFLININAVNLVKANPFTPPSIITTYFNIVEWNFEDVAKRALFNAQGTLNCSSGYEADSDARFVNSITANLNLCGSNFTAFVQGAGGSGTFAPNSNSWENGSDSSKYWQVEFSTEGFSNLTLSSKQQGSNTGPRDFEVEYSYFDGSVWSSFVAVPGSNITVANNFTLGVLNDLTLPGELSDRQGVRLRWVMTSEVSVNGGAVVNTGTNRIDDIVVVGQYLYYLLDYSVDPIEGSITGDLNQNVLFNADGTSVEAVANTGYIFTQWSDGVTDNPRTDLNVQSNISVTAEFEKEEYTLEYFASAGGTLLGNVSQTVLFEEDGTPVEAVADSGYVFSQWSDGVTDNPRTDLNIQGNISVTAEFTEIPSSAPRIVTGSVIRKEEPLRGVDYTDKPEQIGVSSEVSEVVKRGIIKNELREEANKCEVLMIMSRVFEWDVEGYVSTRFEDVPMWCLQVASFAQDKGIVEGREFTVLGTEGSVSRYEVAVMLYRELHRQGYEFKGTEIRQFTDEIVDWAEEAVMTLVREGIIKGFEDGTFGGREGILKQNLGVMLLRVQKSTIVKDDEESVEESYFF